jgi:hypothetical protein
MESVQPDQGDLSKFDQVVFAGLFVSLPPGWLDVTDTLPNEAPPTLAKEFGYGALQFSVARYSSGDDPCIDMLTLEQLIYQFEDNQDLERKMPLITWRTRSAFGVATDYLKSDEFIRVWYCSDGWNLAFVTYTVAHAESLIIASCELLEADRIVRSIQFECDNIEPKPSHVQA